MSSKIWFFSPEFPDKYFDKIFSVSTLEHIPDRHRLSVFQDMHRCLNNGGMELHTIDIGIPNLKMFLSLAF